LTLDALLGKRLAALQRERLAPVTVAVVDSGVDATHPELRGRVTQAARVEPAGKIHRVVKVAVPRNADVYGHGTAVASIICRIAPNARILDVRVLDPSNVCSGDTLIRGFRHAIESRARVINMSLAASAAFAASLRDLCETAYRRNQLVVAARRNMPLTDEGFPAEVATCIGVDNKRLPSQLQVLFRQEGVIEFAAHGEDVMVAAPGGGTTRLTGTSFAAPAVSGICALLVGACPDLRPFDVKTLLRAFATQ
jgi:subtilisin family serine protease